MPKIHRIRIVGLKYDGMQKQYRDTTFDFHNGQTSTNGLIAMMNGGGKGVFLQTIFQVLKPGTAWGKQNNRYYQQFFFNKKEQFVPYTFHVLIEWELDGSDKRHLVTGGMFSAEQRISLNEETESNEREARINPNITFYAREFERKEDVALEHIPLYENGKVAETEELKDYFKWNGYDVYRDIKKHYRILDTYGIKRKDWDIMKDINKDEGGVGKYFEGAEDDHSLFQKRIIPTISQVLERSETQRNDLVEIFKSQASIAKDLPILLKREQAHTEFLEEIQPFEEQVNAAVEHNKVVESSTLQGQQLLGALEHEITLQKEKLTSLEKQMESLQQESSGLAFMRDNLEYAKAHADMKKWETQLAEEKEKHEKAKEILEEKNKEKEQMALALMLKEWSDIEQTILSLSKQIEQLEKNSGLEQVNQRMSEIQTDAKAKWEEAYPVLLEENKQYHSYMKFLEKSVKDLTRQEKQKTKAIFQTESEISSLIAQIQETADKESEWKTRFGDRIIYDLGGFIETLKEKTLAYRSELETIKKQEQDSIRTLNDLSSSKGTLTQTVAQLEEESSKLAERYEKQVRTEESLSDSLKGWIDHIQIPITHAALLKYTTAIEDLLNRNREQYDIITKELWETQLDDYLNDENYWIANQDIKQLKEWIDEKTGIDVFYGTQYLQSMSAEERALSLQNYPLLPYGLVVSEQQWEKVNQQVLNGRIFKSPVPIYMREHMTGVAAEQAFVVLNGEEQQFLNDKQFFSKWKAEISETIEEKKEALLELDKTECSLRSIQKQVDRLSHSELAVDLAKQMEQLEGRLTELNAELKQVALKEEKEKELQTQLRHSLDKTLKIIDKTEKEEELLCAFQKEKEQQSKNSSVKEEKEKRKGLLTGELKEIEAELQTSVQLQKQWSETYLHWKLKTEQDIKEIKRFVENASFPDDETVEASDQPPSLSDRALDDLKNSMKELQLLQKSKEEQAQELLTFQAKRDAQSEQKAKLEKKLKALNKEWQEEIVPEQPLSIIEEMEQSAAKEAKKAAKEERAQEKQVTVAETSLKMAEEQLQKASKKVSKHEQEPESWEGEDLDKKEAEIKDRIKLNKSAIKTADKQHKETEANITGYDGDKYTLSVILNKEAVAFTIEDLEKIQKQGKACVMEWCQTHQDIQAEAEKKKTKLDNSLRKLKLTIEDKDWELRFKNHVLSTFDHMDTRHYEHIQTIVKNMKTFSRTGLEQLEHDKERAERAQHFWASRASMKVMSLADAIRSMLAKMKIKNERATFPLVQLKDDILPKTAEEVEPLLKQHFVSAIEKITAQFEVIDDNNKVLEDEIRKLIGDEQILFVSLRNRYPELLVYNMRTDNAFMYTKPKKEHYSTWQTINQGSRTKSDGSGGQKLSARMIMMMMLLSVKSEHDQSWVSLVCDNPFGQAASAHVLDPIFAVAEKLRFQLIVVTPPELVKTEISQRFEAYYKLDFIRENGKEYVNDTVVPAYRIYQGEEVLQ